MGKLACILRTFDELELTKKSLDILLRNSPEIDLLIIVDGTREDISTETREWIKQYNCPIPCEKVFLDGPYWSTYIWNRGIEKVPEDFDYVLFIDNDVFVTEGWLSSVVGLMELDQRIGEVVPLYTTEDGKVYNKGNMITDQTWIRLDKEVDAFIDANIPYECFSPTLSCAVFRLKALKECEIFNEDVWSYIEAYTGIALYSHNWKIYIQPKSKIVHLKSYTKKKYGTLGTALGEKMIAARYQRQWKDGRSVGNYVDLQKSIRESWDRLPNYRSWPNSMKFYSFDLNEKSVAIRYTELFDTAYGHYYERYYPVEKGMTVIDLGATYGEWAIKIASIASKVIAVEVQQENFDRMVYNLKLNNCTNVIPVHKGIWKTSGRACLKPGRAYDICTVEDGTPDNVDSISLDDLRKEYGLTKVDYLKVDIEGTETDVLRVADLSVYKYIIIETHGNFSEIMKILEEKGLTKVQVVPIEKHPDNQILHVKVEET